MPAPMPALPLLALVMVWGVHGYPDGPPVDRKPEICRTMIPEHDYSRQEGPPPFVINTWYYRTGDTCVGRYTTVTVQIRSIANHTGDTDFNGFFMMAKKPNDDSAAYGTWLIDSSQALETKTLKCFGEEDSAIGHKADVSRDVRNLTWIAPVFIDHDVEFVATIVNGKDRYWVDVRSPQVAYCINNTTPLPGYQGPGDTTSEYRSASPRLHISGACLSLAVASILYISVNVN